MATFSGAGCSGGDCGRRVHVQWPVQVHESTLVHLGPGPCTHEHHTKIKINSNRGPRDDGGRCFESRCMRAQNSGTRALLRGLAALASAFDLHSQSLLLAPCPHSHSFPLVPTHSYSLLLVPTHSYSFLLVPTHSYSFLLVPTHSYSFLLVPTHFFSGNYFSSRVL